MLAPGVALAACAPLRAAPPSVVYLALHSWRGLMRVRRRRTVASCLPLPVGGVGHRRHPAEGERLRHVNAVAAAEKVGGRCCGGARKGEHVGRAHRRGGGRKASAAGPLASAWCGYFIGYGSFLPVVWGLWRGGGRPCTPSLAVAGWPHWPGAFPGVCREARCGGRSVCPAAVLGGAQRRGRDRGARAGPAPVTVGGLNTGNPPLRSSFSRLISPIKLNLRWQSALTRQILFLFHSFSISLYGWATSRVVQHARCVLKCTPGTPSQLAVFLLFWVLKRFAGLGWLLRPNVRAHWSQMRVSDRASVVSTVVPRGEQHPLSPTLPGSTAWSFRGDLVKIWS